MSSIGDQILEEFKNEMNERVEDDKPDMQIEQAMSWFGLIWRMFCIAAKSIFYAVVLNFFFLLYNLGLSDIADLQSAPPEEILEAIDTFFLFSWYLAFVLFGAVASTGEAQRVRNIKKERQERDEEEIRLATRVITLAEEVLHRHGLINKGVKK